VDRREYVGIVPDPHIHHPQEFGSKSTPDPNMVKHVKDINPKYNSIPVSFLDRLIIEVR